MKNCIGLINSGDSKNNYGSLCDKRPDYMLPFGGRYRIVDFTLSNIAQHGIQKVVLYGGRNIRSTLDHVGNGKSWGLNRRRDGLMINPPSYGKDNSISNMKTYYKSLPFFEDTELEHIYASNPMFISRIDISKAYKEYLENDYDVLLLYRKQEDNMGQYLNAQKIILDENGNLENIGLHLGTENVFNMFIENLFIKKEVFIRLVKESMEKWNAITLTQAIVNNKSKLNIGLLEVSRHVEMIRDLNSYYHANMNLLNHGIYIDLLYDGEGILTKAKDEPSTLYRDGCRVSNSILANGCIIEGQVDNSIIFRGVEIGKNAIVKNSIIMQKGVVEDGAIVINSIVDKNGEIRENVFVQGAYNNPYVVEKYQVIERG